VEDNNNGRRGLVSRLSDDVLTYTFNHYIAKPFTVSELGEALNKLLESPPQEDK
jgi:hypothetical protein